MGGPKVPLGTIETLRMNEYDGTNTESSELVAGALRPKSNCEHGSQTLMRPASE